VDFPAGFLELNAPRQRPPVLGNPIFGYSVHPMPPPVVADELPTRTTEKGRVNKQSAENMAKLNELQGMLQEERKLRKDVRRRARLSAPPLLCPEAPRPSGCPLPIPADADVRAFGVFVSSQLEAELAAVRSK